MSTVSEVIALCRTYGPMLRVPDGVYGPRVMAAIAGNESSYGENTKPRYEKAYDFGGAYAGNLPQSELLKAWGSKAAYSYGPWQILPCNAKGFTPDELATDDDKCAQAFVGFFNRYIIGHCHADTLQQILEAFNSGHIVRSGGDIAPGVQRYISDGIAKYHAPPMPLTVTA